MAATSDTHSEAHEHRDVSGGWLRPAVFGAMDGLVTNVSLIAGVGGGGGSPHTLVLTGLAGLAAGAFSMATGEYVSVSSQNELVAAEVRKEKFELENHPDSESRELAATFRLRGAARAACAGWTLTSPSRWHGRFQRTRSRPSPCTSARNSGSITPTSRRRTPRRAPHWSRSPWER